MFVLTIIKILMLFWNVFVWSPSAFFFFALLLPPSPVFSSFLLMSNKWEYAPNHRTVSILQEMRTRIEFMTFWKERWMCSSLFPFFCSFVCTPSFTFTRFWASNAPTCSQMNFTQLPASIRVICHLLMHTNPFTTAFYHRPPSPARRTGVNPHIHPIYNSLPSCSYLSSFPTQPNSFFPMSAYMFSPHHFSCLWVFFFFTTAALYTPLVAAASLLKVQIWFMLFPWRWRRWHY